MIDNHKIIFNSTGKSLVQGDFLIFTHIIPLNHKKGVHCIVAIENKYEEIGSPLCVTIICRNCI